MDYKFNEQYNYEKGFEEYLNNEIASLLEQAENHKSVTLKKLILIAFLSILLIVIIVFQSNFDFVEYIEWALLILIIPALTMTYNSFKRHSMEKIISRLLKFFGDYTLKSYVQDDIESIDYKPLKDHVDFFTGNYKYIDYTNYISGQYGKAFIEYSEIEIIEEYIKPIERNVGFESFGREGLVRYGEDDPQTRTKFFGIAIIITFPEAFYGKTIVVKDRTNFHSLFAKSNNQLFLLQSPEDTNLELRLEAYSDLPAESKHLLNSTIKHKIKLLAKHYGISSINCCFTREKAVFAIPTEKKIIETFSLFKPIYNEYKFKCFLRDFKMILCITDDLLKYFENRKMREQKTKTQEL